MSLAHYTHFSLQHKDKDRRLKKPNICYVFEKQGVQEYQRWHSQVTDHIQTASSPDQTRPDQRLHSRGPNSWTCVLVLGLALHCTAYSAPAVLRNVNLDHLRAKLPVALGAIVLGVNQAAKVCKFNIQQFANLTFKTCFQIHVGWVEYIWFGPILK